MKIKYILLIGIFITLTSTAIAAPYQKGWGTSVIDQKTGKSGVKIGGRLQAIAAVDSETETQDFYFRRMRVNFSYNPKPNHKIVYDVRNDNANQGDRGEETFNIGDAYWQIDFKKFKFKAFRGKVDVSYSQTSSSKNLFTPERTFVSEHASDFVVENRRANNVQINGNLGNLSYHVVLSDGVNSNDLEDVAGNEVEAVDGQKFTYGGKLRYYFFGDPVKNPAQDTFYGKHDTFSIGAAFFANDKIIVDNSTATGSQVSQFNMARNLTNIELSFAKGGLRILGEYFAFSGDIIDLTAADKEDILGDSNGYYIQSEYVFNKLAPFISYEVFDKNLDSDDAQLTNTTVGINYYQDLEGERYGIAYRLTENEDELNNGDDEEFLYAYIMLNF